MKYYIKRHLPLFSNTAYCTGVYTMFIRGNVFIEINMYLRTRCIVLLCSYIKRKSQFVSNLWLTHCKSFKSETDEDEILIDFIWIVWHFVTPALWLIPPEWSGIDCIWNGLLNISQIQNKYMQTQTMCVCVCVRHEMVGCTDIDTITGLFGFRFQFIGDGNTMRPQKMAATFQPKFSNYFSCMQIALCIQISLTFVLMVQLSIHQHWFR